MGNLFSFIFLTFPSFSFIFFKTEKAVHRGVHSVEFLGQVSNVAPWEWCTITSLTSNGALSPGAPLLVLKKKLLLVANRGCGAPLVFGH